MPLLLPSLWFLVPVLEQHLHALLHKQFEVDTPDGRVTVTLDIVPDDDDPHAWLAAVDAFGAELARQRVAPNFKLSAARAAAWVDANYAIGG